MKGYGTREVAGMLGLSAGQVRAYVRSGFLEPARGPRRAYRFSFQDLVFLRTAQGLLAARIGPRRVRRALRKLRDELPEGRPLAGLRIMAEGGRIVVGDGARRWQADSGQILFDFEISEIVRKAAPVARHAFREAKKRDVELRTAASGSPAGRDAEGMSAEDWYAWGCELEAAAPAEAREAYERALALDPAHADALVNMGRLCHEAGDLLGAEEHYRGALACRPDHGTAAYDLGVVLQDLGLQDEAIDVYETAVRIDPGNADAHYNVARLYEDRGRNADAVRHLKAYRKLTMARRR